LTTLNVGGGGGIVSVATALGCGQLGGEDPEIGGAGVEVEVEGLLMSVG